MDERWVQAAQVPPTKSSLGQSNKSYAEVDHVSRTHKNKSLGRPIGSDQTRGWYPIKGPPINQKSPPILSSYWTKFPIEKDQSMIKYPSKASRRPRRQSN